MKVSLLHGSTPAREQSCVFRVRGIIIKCSLAYSCDLKDLTKLSGGFIKFEMSAVDICRKLGEDGRSLKLAGNVGFVSLPDQLVNKRVNHGFYFNILCVGETGIGKSTLMDCLFKTMFDSVPHSHHSSDVSIESHLYEIRERNVNLKLTIVDTVGYGDQVDKSDSYEKVIEYIDQQFDAYLHEELKIKRSLTTYHDTRVHACLYFISPTGHSLKSLDLVCMKQLDKKVNVIPIIAKADTISPSELKEFKTKIMDELNSGDVQIYKFPVDDEKEAEINASMNEQVPFAVVGSREEVTVGKEKVRARQYPWGTVVVENENHCDFVKLREMLLRTNMADLIEKTHEKHYELYRKNKLTDMGFTDTDSESQPLSLQETYEQRRKDYMGELQKREDEMRSNFIKKVKEKEAELKQEEQELYAKFEQLKKVQADEKKSLQQKQQQLDEEVNLFEQRKKQATLMAQTQKEKRRK
ncbi:septin-8-A-like [Xenia sp. Carnegie-2017]|uniref:septin-8-A-like n=1 Tax=Xenia sp. Carnegie-2017 TaxID=2897299 RepID=UPI001F04880E|nr:septin-8-A-like [Xenia sp. Carnegie-2017]